MEDVSQLIAHDQKINQQLIITYREPFEEIFKVSLDDYQHPLDLGFDIVKFDQEIIGDETSDIPGKGVCMQDVILRDWGKIALQTIKGLCNIE